MALMTDAEAIASVVADILDGIPRIGEARDDPEGVRYIQLSDTLARQLSRLLRGHESFEDFIVDYYARLPRVAKAPKPEPPKNVILREDKDPRTSERRR